MKAFCNFDSVLFLLVLFATAIFAVQDDDSLIERHFVLSEDYSVNWTLSVEAETIIFQVEVRTLGWFGLGISVNGAMRGADIVIGGFRTNGTPYFEDRHGVGNQEPVLDTVQNWFLETATRNETHTIATFYRQLNTEDELQDVEITSDTLRLIWAFGPTPLPDYHGATNRGIQSVNFLDPEVDPISQEELEKLYSVWKTQKPFLVPRNDTIYRCSFFKGPDVSKLHHMVGFNMHIDRQDLSRHVHHADLYRCSAPPGVDADEYFAPYLGDGYDCNYSPIPFPFDDCGTFEFQWTIGGGITLFPDNLGMPIGLDSGRTEYYMTEVHYDNPEGLEGLQITAGFNVFYTDQKREIEVGHLQLGVMTNKTYSLTLPPNSPSFVVSSHCPQECTSSLPPDGINVFTYLLHSHLAGRALKLRHFRDGKELAVLAKDDHFDFRYQNNRRLRTPVKILPRDHLTFECTYDNTGRSGKATLGGRAARDEMCQAFLLYYPRIHDVNSCGSYNPQQKILNYMGVESVFQTQGEIDATVLAPQHFAGMKYTQVVENYVNWTAEKRADYQRIARYEEQQAYCIPKHYHNASFVLTKYPIDQLPGTTTTTTTTTTTMAPSPNTTMTNGAAAVTSVTVTTMGRLVVLICLTVVGVAAVTEFGRLT